MAEVQPPPVILYPQSTDQSHNNGAGHYSQSGSSIRPIEPPPHPPVDPRYPPQYDPRFQDQRHTGQTDGSLAIRNTDNKYYPVTPQRRPSLPVPEHAASDTLPSGVSNTKAKNKKHDKIYSNGTEHFLPTNSVTVLYYSWKNISYSNLDATVA